MNRRALTPFTEIVLRQVLRSYLLPKKPPQSSRNVESEEFGKLMDLCIIGSVRVLSVNRSDLTPFISGVFLRIQMPTSYSRPGQQILPKT